MNITSIPASIVLMALTIYLCIYIYRKDTIEKEPLTLLALLFAAGMVSYALAAVLEYVLVGGIDQLFRPFMTFDGAGIKIYTSDTMEILHILSCAAMVALLEESIRGLVLYLLTHKNKNFNYTFDGIVYAVFLYLGFGLVEAFRYVLSGGFGSVLLRAVLCIPAHMFMGVIMGCCYTGWHKKSLKKKKDGGKGVGIPVYLIIPILFHVCYAFFNLYASYKGGYLSLIVSVILCVLSVILIRKKAAKDTMIALILSMSLLFGGMMPMELEAAGESNSTSSSTKNNGFYYKQLDANGKKVYNTMTKVIPKRDLSGTCKLAGPVEDWDTVWKGIYAYQLENPEYFWLNGGASARWHWGEENTIDIDFVASPYWSQMFNHKGEKQKLDKAVKKVAKLAKEKKGKIKQIEFVHNYLVNHCKYDYDRLASSEKTIHDPFDDLIYTAYGCLVQKRAVCAGYAKAFQLIMRELGIKCDYVMGYAGREKSKGTHAWDCVTLGGEQYWLDATWDDMDGNLKNADEKHTFFLETTKQMKKTHKPEDLNYDFKVPMAKGTKYEYFTSNKYTLKEYNTTKMDEILAKQKSKKWMEVRFTSSKAYKKAKQAVIDNNCWLPKSIGYNGYRYSWDDDYYELRFYVL